MYLIAVLKYVTAQVVRHTFKYLKVFNYDEEPKNFFPAKVAQEMCVKEVA